MIDAGAAARAGERGRDARMSSTARRAPRASGSRPIRRAAGGPRSAAWSRPMPRAPAPCATAACGPGSTALELVTADGEVAAPGPRRRAAGSGRHRALQPGRRARNPRRRRPDRARPSPTRKNSSGYALDAWLASGDLLDLVIGAEGTLGVVTAAEWRLDRVPGHRVGLRIALATMDRFAEVIGILLDSRPVGRRAARPDVSEPGRRTAPGTGRGGGRCGGDDPGRARVE